MNTISDMSGRALEEEVANFYRECGAMKVEVDVEMAGNQIDVYIEELSISGNLVRTIIECKDHSETIGVHRINDFATVFRNLKFAGLADKAVLIAATAFSRQGRAAAAAAQVGLLTANDIRSRLKRLSSIQLVTVANPNLGFALDRAGRAIGYRSEPIMVGGVPFDMELASDPSLIQRVKLLAEYIKELERLSTDPSGRVLTVDTTGTATSFANWISNPLYMAILQAGFLYGESFRRRHGDADVAVQRNFVVDIDDLTPQLINNLEKTLRLHVRFGIGAGIIFRSARVPNEVVADIANLAERVCIDYGRVEGLGVTPPRLLDVMAPVGDPQFRRIRERVAWASDRKHLDAFAQRKEDIRDVMAEVRSRLRKSKKARNPL